MQKEFTIEGMTCNSCVETVVEKLSVIDEVIEAKVQLESPQAILKLTKEISIADLQQELGKYQISEISKPHESAPDLPEIKLSTYKPLFLIVGFIIGISLMAQFPFDEFSFGKWMRHFMSGFFLVFSFFKLLDVRAFANSYRMYDIIAARLFWWGYIYPFIELLLGISYFIDFMPLLTNITTAIILGVSSIGVIQSNLNKQKIKCACLGNVFNLPMSTVTIVEDVTMVLMAIVMIITI